MECKQLIDAVKKMRSYQVDFFATRSQNSLIKSKQYEKIVDELIQNIDQPKLF